MLFEKHGTLTSSDRALLSDVGKLVGSHRELTARLVAYLGEIEERRLHLRAGFPSLFKFCIHELKLSENEAFRRIVAARLGRRFPVVYSLLASGRVHLSALELLRERLTEANHRDLLEAVSGKSKEEIEAILAARYPRADVSTRVRRLPDSPVPAGSTAAYFDLGPSGSHGEHGSRRDRVEPLSPARFRVEFTASTELREKLELCRDLMSHSYPSRDLGVVVERAVNLLLADLKKKRLAQTKRPQRKRVPARASESRITSATRRRVFERDGIRCTYVSPEGRRCEARAFLELDHAEPRALGGTNDAANLRVRCRAHNQLWAEQAMGREYIEQRRRFGRKKSKCPESTDRPADDKSQPDEVASRGTIEKVRAALQKMGFRASEARRATEAVERKHDGSLTVEHALREALLAATPGAG